MRTYSHFAAGDKLKNLDKELYETALIIGRRNFAKTQLDKDIKERMEMMGHCNSIMMGKGQEANG